MAHANQEMEMGQMQAVASEVPYTEGIKYAGSKLKLLPHILSAIEDLQVHKILDGFSGTTRVSQALARGGYSVCSSDISHWSQTFATCYLLAEKSKSYYQELIDHLNSVPSVHGWFSQHYGGEAPLEEKQSDRENDVENKITGGEKQKRPFQLKNTRKLDAIRTEIDRLNLDETDKAVALTSLILALDKVDSTLGHYVSYLHEWSPRSFRDLELVLPNMVHSKDCPPAMQTSDLSQTSRQHKVIRGDIFDTLKQNSFDLCYFDPPYGSNNEKMPPSRVRYASYYHIWTTVILNDQPNLFGKVNRRADSRDLESASVFEDFRQDADGRFVAMQAIDRMIQAAQSRYVLLSYSSGGRATKEQLLETLNSAGKVLKALEIDYKHNVMGSMRWTSEWVNSDQPHREYLFLLEKK